MANDVRIVGGQRQLLPKHQFQVEIAPDWWAGFQTCSELSLEVAKIEYWEGGSTIPLKVPGRATFPDITLERGASSSIKMHNWIKQVVNAAAIEGGGVRRGTGQNYISIYGKEVSIVQLDRDGVTKIREWTLAKAWPIKYVAGDWDNNADEVVIESLTLTFDFFDLAD